MDPNYIDAAASYFPPVALVARAGGDGLPGMTGRIRTVVSVAESRAASSSMRCTVYWPSRRYFTFAIRYENPALATRFSHSPCAVSSGASVPPLKNVTCGHALIEKRPAACPEPACPELACPELACPELACPDLVEGVEGVEGPPPPNSPAGPPPRPAPTRRLPLGSPVSGSL